MSESEIYAPGWPGIPARWTSSAKSGVGTAVNVGSHVWFTLSHGILNEIYYPRLDQACTRDMGLIVADGAQFLSEEKRDTDHQIAYLADGVPGFRLVNTCQQNRYRIEKVIVSDPERAVILQSTRLVPLQGKLEDLHLYVLLAPHLANRGAGNTAWVGDYKGIPMLFAQREDTALALAYSGGGVLPRLREASWLNRSVGFVGASDGWQDLTRHHALTWAYTRAENGNVSLVGEVDLRATGGVFTLALGFGSTPAEAGQLALGSLADGFEAVRAQFVAEWQAWQKGVLPMPPEPGGRDLYRVSMAVLRTHESKRFLGDLIASLSIPWGIAKGDNNLGGYHLAWPRDLVESAGGLLAAGMATEAWRVLQYLRITQEPDGHWPQNMWMDGTPYWTGLQMDETALPILFVDLARREKALNDIQLSAIWPMVRRAAGYLVRNGPVTQQDRWEEDPGYSPFTLGAEIAALLAAADLADLHGEPALAAYLRETADVWNDNVERWTYVTDTDLARRVGVKGYYVRIGAVDVAESASPAGGFVPIENRPPDQSCASAAEIVSPDALALVRFGLRAPDDARILDTVKAIDALLKLDTPFGPAWHRYNGDGYGEHVDGSAFDGTGVGRLWPLFTGERAHYELAAGHRDAAESLRQTLEALANESGLLPEQTWDSADIPNLGLFFGRPAGSAMPLVWAHAEYVKLRRSLRDNRVFDQPVAATERYVLHSTGSPFAFWRFNNKIHTAQAGKNLRVEVLSRAVVHWSTDGWHTLHDSQTRDMALGVHVADLPTAGLAAGMTIVFTFFWPDAERWEGTDFSVQFASP